MQINNRRYTGSKYKLMPWIKDIMVNKCNVHDILFDVFAGTGVVTAECLDITKKNIINDFLYSNEVIYKAFFGKEKYSKKVLDKHLVEFNEINVSKVKKNYVSKNFGGKYFSFDDALLIGEIREKIETLYSEKKINKKEYYILLASLIYSFDRCANTVGHYEAYIKSKNIKDEFKFDLIEPLKTDNEIIIYRSDANDLAKTIKSDVAFIDPPYNSRQYSRFYHVLETITKWDKPELYGVAMKPKEENMSEYSRNNATNVFRELICDLDTKYILVTYNNTYDSKSSSSKNKITLDEIREILNKKGRTTIYEKKYHRFSAGKTEKVDHKEFLFLTKVGK